MGHAYKILGRTVPSHQLAIGTLGLAALFCVPNPFATKQEAKIDLHAGSPEEEKFIQEYIKKHTETK